MFNIVYCPLIAEFRYSRYAELGSGEENDTCTACIVGTYADSGVCACGVCVCVCGVCVCVCVGCVCVGCVCVQLLGW